MKKKTVVISGLIIILVVLTVAVGIISYNLRDTFQGNRVRNPDCYVMEFERMNQTDRHELELHAGDALAVDLGIDKGRVDLTIGKAGEEPIYQGNDIETCSFQVVVPEDGTYVITVVAKHAKGHVNIHAPGAAE